MVKASINLKSGATVQIEGTVEEVRQLMQFYDGNAPTAPEVHVKRSHQEKLRSNVNTESSQVDCEQIANNLKQCEKMELFESKILDKPGGVNSVLLPLYFIHLYGNGEPALTSGDIRKVLAKLGIDMSLSGVSHVLSGRGAKYVIGTKSTGASHAVNYKISRLGVKYLEDEVFASNK